MGGVAACRARVVYRWRDGGRFWKSPKYEPLCPKLARPIAQRSHSVGVVGDDVEMSRDIDAAIDFYASVFAAALGAHGLPTSWWMKQKLFIAVNSSR